MAGGVVYLVERVVLATPKNRLMNCGRLVLGVVMSVLGASVVDLIVFEREISEELYRSGEARIESNYNESTRTQTQVIIQRKEDWMRAEADAKCEANGNCGTHQANLGPVYLSLVNHAGVLRADYIAAQSRLDEIAAKRSQELDEWRNSPKALESAGLLQRIEALKTYVHTHSIALTAWILFFLMVLIFELMVVLVKIFSVRTVDDDIADAREAISRHQTNAALEAATSPLRATRELLNSTYA